jgi:hypothetical protein
MRPLPIATPVALFAAAALFPVPAQADEPLFGFIYTTDILPRNQAEAEQWVTLREGRSNGDFHLVQTRSELSYGLTNNLQLSGYLDFAHADVKDNGPDGTTVPPEIFADYDSNPDKRFTKTRFQDVSVEAIYRFSSPYKSPIGAALYFEPSIGPRTRELEARLILQKNFIDDRLVFAFNATLAYEWRKLHADPEAEPGSIEARDHWDKETDVNFGLAASYRFASKWSFGAEVQNEREWARLDPFDAKNRINQAWYAGPTIHYGGRKFFATFTTLFQLPMGHDYAEKDNAIDAVIHGLNNADDFEKYRFRLKLGTFF